MDDIFVYVTALPDKVNEIVTPCLDGYTVYINDDLSTSERISALNHAIQHIRNMDFQKDDVQEIEAVNE